ncbi:amino acid ABC transporter permease [Halostella sp. PRR32]|uniref:amino acid ABC transporter permease n=1 Tax=Halostella sp. PRR32 TaxID=3098147 RepID=UPI002B1DACAE|nr:amino acid ABC transporter permease [Halostella sp. PRR32]
MSETATRSRTGIFRSLSPGQVITAAAGILFWGWLAVRLLNDWGVVDAGAAPDEPFVDPAGLPEWIPEWVAFAVEFLPQMASGVYLTVVLTVAGITFGFVLAVPLSIARVYGTTSSYLSLAFTELIRGTPLLVQLFVLYYGIGLTSFLGGLPGVGQGWVPDEAVWVAIVGFTINSAAYQAEYIRSALISVEESQLTAARAIGLSKLDGIRYVVLPQGLRYAIPGWTNELVYLIKYSSLAAFITVPELFHQAQDISSNNFRYTAVFTLAGVLYLALVISAAKLMETVERRTSIPGVGRIKGRQ